MRPQGTGVVLGRPMCAVCGRLVDRMIEVNDPWLPRVRFEVWCHGESQTVELDTTGLATVDPSAGVAFADSPRRLAAPE